MGWRWLRKRLFGLELLALVRLNSGHLCFLCLLDAEIRDRQGMGVAVLSMRILHPPAQLWSQMCKAALAPTLKSQW